MSTLGNVVTLSPEAEGKRLCVCAIADELKKMAALNPTPREKFMIASVTQAIGWSADMYVDLGFNHEADEQKGTQG